MVAVAALPLVEAVAALQFQVLAGLLLLELLRPFWRSSFLQLWTGPSGENLRSTPCTWEESCSIRSSLREAALSVVRSTSLGKLSLCRLLCALLRLLLETEATKADCCIVP